MIRCNALQIGFKDPLLQCNELILNLGELYCLIGKNGAGKSTFLKTIMGDLSPLSGEIEIADQNLNSLTPYSKAKLIAFVPSKFEGIRYLTAFEYISKGRIPHTNYFGKLTSKDLKIINDAIAFTEVGDLLNKDTTLLSDGERQLISITKALTQDTP